MNETRKRPESDNNNDDEEELINVAEKRQRTPAMSDDSNIEAADFVAEFPVHHEEDEDPKLMALMKVFAEEIISHHHSISIFSSTLPSSFQTINDNGESCGVFSFSDLDPKTSVMNGIDIGVSSLCAFLMRDSDILIDWSRRATSFLEGNGEEESSADDLIKWILSLPDPTFSKTEENVQEGEKEDGQKEMINGCGVEKRVLSLPDATIKTEENGEEEESSVDVDKRVLSSTEAPIKTEENGEEESSVDIDKRFLSSSEETIKTEENGEEEEEEGSDDYGWIENVVNEYPFGFQEEVEV